MFYLRYAAKVYWGNYIFYLRREKGGGGGGRGGVTKANCEHSHLTSILIKEMNQMII